LRDFLGQGFCVELKMWCFEVLDEKNRQKREENTKRGIGFFKWGILLKEITNKDFPGIL